MAVDVTTTVTIGRPIDQVAAYAGDPSNSPTWYVNIKSVEWVTGPPLQVGSKLSFVARFLGRSLSYVYEVTDLVPGRRLVMRTAQGPFPMETTYTWTELAGSTEMTLRNRGEPTGYSKFLSPLMVWAMRRANGKDLARLRALLEET